MFFIFLTLVEEHTKKVSHFFLIFSSTHSRAIKKLFKQQRAFFLSLQTCNVYVDIAHTNSHQKLQHSSLKTLSGAAAARPCLSERRAAKNKWKFHYWSQSFSYRMIWMMFYFLCSEKSQAKLNDNSSELVVASPTKKNATAQNFIIWNHIINFLEIISSGRLYRSEERFNSLDLSETQGSVTFHTHKSKTHSQACNITH